MLAHVKMHFYMSLNESGKENVYFRTTFRRTVVDQCAAQGLK